MSKVQPLLVILGPTASGKSALALELAERMNGEIIAADSRTIYIGMDIGTAKPTLADQTRIPHHGLDLITPEKSFTVADFKQYAEQKIVDIANRGKLPILVGGSGLYIDAIVYDYAFQSTRNMVLRSELEALTVEQLQDQVVDLGLALPENKRNPRYLIRMIETGRSPRVVDRAHDIRPNTCMLGINMNISILEKRIAARVDDMVRGGFADEVSRLDKLYGTDVQALQAPGYRAFRNYIDGTQTLDEAKASFIKYDRALAKRQKTWFRRNKSIHWLSNSDKLAEAVDIATTMLDT